MTIHISDPYIASILDTISASERGIDVKELRAAHPAEDDDAPNDMHDALNELRKRGAIEIRSGRYFPVKTIELTGTTSLPTAQAIARQQLQRAMGTSMPANSAKPTKEQPMPKQKLSVRDTVREALAKGPASADQLAASTGLTRKQCIDTCVQLTIKGEFAIDKKGIGGAATTYRVATAKTRASKVEKIGKLVARKVAAGKAAKPGKRKYAKRTEPSASRELVVAPGMPDNKIVAMQPNGDVVVLDVTDRSYQEIPAAVVQKILGFAQFAARA